MRKIQYFFWLIKQSWLGISYDWKISLTLLIIALIALLLNKPFKRKSFTRQNLLLLMPFAITVMLFLMGTILAHDNSHALAPTWPVYLLIGIAMLHIPLGGFLAWKMKGFRWSTIALNIFQMQLSRWALFVVGMSVTGDWL
jgi:hypothetical protein